MLKQGAVGAFAITRVLASVRVGEQCTALPLECLFVNRSLRLRLRLDLRVLNAELRPCKPAGPARVPWYLQLCS